MMDPQEGAVATGPNGERAVFMNGHWVVQAASAPMILPPDPRKVAEAKKETDRKAAADRRAENADRRAQAEFERRQSEATPATTPGDASKTGEAYLATLPPALAGQVKALSEGRRAFPTGSALRSPAMQELVAAATQYDPTLDAANAATRVATRKNFTSGKARANITAINTALGHLGSLSEKADALDNKGWRSWNTIGNAILTETGDQRVKDFGIARDAVANELMKVFRNTGGSLAEIEDWKHTIDSSDSPEQLRAEISTAVELLNSRLMSMQDEYQQGMGKSADVYEFLTPKSKKIFDALAPGGSGHVGDAGSPPPNGTDRGGPNLELATGDKKTSFDPVTSAKVDALIRRGRPLSEAQAILPPGSSPIDPKQYAAAVAYAKQHPDYGKSLAEVTQTEPTTGWERFAASPLAAGVVGASSGLTAGLNDELAGAASYLTGNGYTEGRDKFNAGKNILAEEHPGATMAGNVAGGLVAGAGGSALLGRFAPNLGTRLIGSLAPRARYAQTAEDVARIGADRAAMAGDALYGSVYGAGENNDNRIEGAGLGALTAVGAGQGARSATRGLANVISPPAGKFAPLYEQGVFPTIGQRFGESGLAGRIANGAEQALQSFPGFGYAISRARQIPRDKFQIGAFDEALGEIGQNLPPGMTPGTDPHSFAKRAFDEAFDRARSGMRFVADDQFASDLGAFQQSLNDNVLTADQAKQVAGAVQSALGSRTAGGQMTGDAYKAAVSDLGRIADTWGKNPNTSAMAAKLNDFRTMVDNAARRSSDPAAVKALDDADRGYAKLVRIQSAAKRVGGHAGTFSPAGFDRAVQNEAGGVRSAPYLRGEALMQDYADAGRGLIDTMPNSGTPERLMTGQAVAGFGGTAAGIPSVLAAHPGSLAPFALYAPGMNKLVTRMIAPRAATMSPEKALAFEDMASLIRQKAAPVAGSLAPPLALPWMMGGGQ